MAIHFHKLLLGVLLFVVFAQFPLPGHSIQEGSGMGLNKWCRSRYTKPLFLAVTNPDAEPEDIVTKKIFNTYKCVTEKMQQEFIFIEEDSRVIEAASECCALVYGTDPNSSKCQKLARRMKVCLDFAITITGDALTKGIYSPGGTQALFGSGVFPPFGGGYYPWQGMMNTMGMGLPLYGGIHPMHAMMHPFHGGIHAMHAMMNPFLGGIHPMHRMMYSMGVGLPFYGGIHPMHAMMNPFFGGMHGMMHPMGMSLPFYGGVNPMYGMMNPMSMYGSMGLGGMGYHGMGMGGSSRRPELYSKNYREDREHF